jgi:hypothetical protein
MAKTLTLRLEDDVYQLFADAARAENESLDRQSLLERLRRGSADARAGRGAFVE